MVNDNRAMIAPFWADVDIANGGEIWYAEVTRQDVLQRASQDVRDAFTAFSGFTAKWTYIATWYKVPFYGSTDLVCNQNFALNNNSVIGSVHIVTSGNKPFDLRPRAKS